MTYTCSDRMCGAADCTSCRGADAGDEMDDPSPLCEDCGSVLTLQDRNPRWCNDCMDAENEEDGAGEMFDHLAMVELAQMSDGGMLP